MGSYIFEFISRFFSVIAKTQTGRMRRISFSYRSTLEDIVKMIDIKAIEGELTATEFRFMEADYSSFLRALMAY